MPDQFSMRTGPKEHQPYDPPLTRDQVMVGAEMAAGFLPGIGDALSVKDAYLAGRGALSEFGAGNYGRGALSAGEAGLGALGVLPFIPNLAGVIKAYHGSPHRFDKFSMDKIGTGEGAQAYGHGLYYSESPDVAREYQAQLADRPDVLVAGKPVSFTASTPDSTVAAKLSGAMQKQDVGPALRQVYSELDRGMDAAIGRDDFDTWAVLNDQKSSLQHMEEQGIGRMQKGSFYEVTLQLDHEDLLDWDAPLSEQSPEVRASIGNIASKLSPEAVEDLGGDVSLLSNASSGSELYDTLMSLSGIGGPAQASKALKAAGVPGLKYFDSVSRNAKDGTRNIVLFDDNLVSIDRVE